MRAAGARGLIPGARAAGKARWRGGAGMLRVARGRRLLAAGRALVRGALRHADAGAGRGLAGHRARRRHADRRADRLGEDARRLPLVARPAAARGRDGRAGGTHRRRLRLAAEGARQRRAADPRSPARRDARAGGGGGCAAARDPRPGALRRHASRRAPGDGAPPAAHPGDHAGVALHPAHRRGQPALARRCAHGHRRRDPRRRRRQAGRAPGPLARAPGRARGAAAPAHRSLRHAAPHRRGGAPAGRRGGAARARATLIQRVGRSGHARGAVPKGVVFPLTRDDLVQAAAAVRAVRAGELDTLRVPESPLDILAQQCVATVATGDLQVDELWALVRRAHSFRRLERADFDAVLDMMADGVATRRGRRGALLHLDRVHGRVRARRGARLAAITSGGAIPDNADYEVVEEPQGLKVGTVNEDFAVESMAGDIFLLGNRSWRIRRVEAGRVRVEDAAGAPPTIPFWLGEAPARTRELSAAVSALRAAVAARLPDTSWLVDACGLSADAAAQLGAYVGATEAALGTVPTTGCVVAERFFDEAGGMQLVVHAPFGGRINRAWGLALRKRFCVTFNFELQAAATDDGLVISLGEQHSFPLDSVFAMVRRETLHEDLVQAALASPLFTNRWRWNA